MNTSSIVGLVVVILVALGGWYFYMNPSSAPAPAPATTSDSTNTTGGAASQGGSSTGGASVDVGVEVGGAPMSASVTYSSSGFSPSEITIRRGGTVTWRNEGGGTMWVASAMHPTHTTYSGTTLQEHCDTLSNDSFDQCQNGGTYSFTFDKVGTWAYHNHSQSSHFGRVIVVE